MPTPYKSETESQFMKRCQASPGMDRNKCKRKWTEAKGRKNMRVIELREHRQIDMTKVRAVAMNPDLQEHDVFDFGTFIICRSGVNRNHTDITGEGQKTASKEWIGKAILFRDHETESSNQIGRIYDAWTEERPGEVVTLGKGFGVVTDDLADIFKRIENGIHREMSCAYEPVRSLCSECGGDLIGDRLMSCSNGHSIGRDGIYAKDVEFKPDHISFVGRPAVEGAGLIAAGDEQKLLRIFADLGDDPEQTIRELRRDADDGKAYRAFVQDEFTRWFGLANPDAEQDEISTLAEKLSAKEMCRLARIEKDRFHEVLPQGGKQMMSSSPEPEEQAEIEEPISLRDIASAMKG